VPVRRDALGPPDEVGILEERHDVTGAGFLDGLVRSRQAPLSSAKPIFKTGYRPQQI
jgi:hypothetical protein